MNPPDSNLATVNTIRGWVTRHAEATPDKPFLHSVDQGISVTYRILHDACRRIAADLQARGIGANDRVALLSDNSVEHIVTYFGVMYASATICTIHVEMNQPIIHELLSSLAPRLVLYEQGRDLEDRVRDAGDEALPLGNWNEPDADTYMAAIFDGATPEDFEVAPRANDVASIFYTSGTTAKPKGLLCTFYDLGRNVGSVTAAFGITYADRILDFRSFNWMSAQTLSAVGTLATGATLFMARKFSHSRFFDWIRVNEITIAAANPTVINMLINRPIDITRKDLSSLRFITSSSAPLLIEDWRRFEARYDIPIRQGYGASETGWIAASGEHAWRLGSVGRPLAYQDVRVVNANDQRLAPNEIGYIELGGPGRLFRHLTENGATVTAASERIRTGDMGYLDPEGFLFIVGREKDLIVRGGVNISPVEVDNVLMEMPGIAEAAAFGVADRIYGEEVAAAVVAEAQTELTEDAVTAFCRDRLAEPKVPKTIYFYKTLPKTERGKLDRAAIARPAEQDEGVS